MSDNEFRRRAPSSARGVENEGFEMQEPHNNQISFPAIDKNENETKAQKNGKISSVNIPEESGKPEFEDLEYDPGSVFILARLINGIRVGLHNLIKHNISIVKIAALVIIFVLFNAYFITAVLYNRRNDINWAWCDGHGLLIILFVFIYWCLFYYHVLKRFFGKKINEAVIKPTVKLGDRVFSKWYMRFLAAILVLGGVVAFIVVDAWDTPKRMISAVGIVVMVLLGLIFSQHPGRVQWRQVLGGMLVQFIFGLLVLRWEGGRNFLDCFSSKVTRFLSFSDEGSSFVYGYLSSGSLLIENSTLADLNGNTIVFSTLFAFKALSVIYFFSFFVGLLYHVGIMTWVVMKVGWVLQVLLGTTAAESMNASANIFLGQTEAPILIKPFMNDMTRSEIHAVMTGGFATIAGSVLAAYISFGVDARSLLTASVMAAPAALAFSKLVYPETQKSKTSLKEIEAMDTKADGNALDAAAAGAAQGFILIGNIIANLIAVISFVAFLNAIVSWLGVLVGQEQMSFEWILGKIFIPFAFCLGVDQKDTEDVALLLGLKVVVNEFVAYQRLISVKDRLTPRSIRIAEYALCSFGNFSSVGIQLGGLSTLAPLRRTDFSKVVWSALLAGTLTSLLNACVAGTLLDDASLT